MKAISLKKTIPLLLAAALALAAGSAAFAAVEAAADRESVTEGDLVQVTFTVTGKELAVAEGTFSYDPALLSFNGDESSAGVTDGLFAVYSAEKNGSATLTARAAFTAREAGAAKVSFRLENLLSYDGDALDTGSAEVAVTIAAAPPAPTEPPVVYSDPAVTVKAENVLGAAGDMYVWRSIENVTIPSRYQEADVEYHGETVKGAVVKDSDAPTLLYLSDAAGENGAYYVYDAAADSLYRYRTVSSVSKSYILLRPDDTVHIPEGFRETFLTISGAEVQAWETTDAQGSVYLVYARNPAGEVGFYYYSLEDESLQRYAVLPARPVAPTATPAPAATPAPTATPAQDTARIMPGRDNTAFYIACGAALLFLCLFIASVVSHAVKEKRRRKRAAERRRARAERSGRIEN